MLKSNIMNKKHIKYLQGSVIGAACIAAFASCTDDHFDVNPDVAGRTTLWENIQSNENLSQFAEILSAAAGLFGKTADHPSLRKVFR